MTFPRRRPLHLLPRAHGVDAGAAAADRLPVEVPAPGAESVLGLRRPAPGPRLLETTRAERRAELVPLEVALPARWVPLPAQAPCPAARALGDAPLLPATARPGGPLGSCTRDGRGRLVGPLPVARRRRGRPLGE